MTPKLNQRAVEIILSNQLGYERIAMACSASFAGLHGCPAERIEDLKTIVAEAAMNAMEHGNKGRTDAKVTVLMNFHDDAINVAVMDEGNGIERFPPIPDIERVMDNLDPPTGFGLFLIRQLADRVEFDRKTDGGHVVKIAIKLKSNTQRHNLLSFAGLAGAQDEKSHAGDAA